MKVKIFNGGYIVDGEFLQYGSTTTKWEELQTWLETNEAEPEFTNEELVTMELNKKLVEAKQYLDDTEHKFNTDYELKVGEDLEPIRAKRSEARAFIRANKEEV